MGASLRYDLNLRVRIADAVKTQRHLIAFSAGVLIAGRLIWRRGWLMGSAIGLRDDFGGTALRQLARKSKSANQARRLLALAEICDGGIRIVDV